MRLAQFCITALLAAAILLAASSATFANDRANRQQSPVRDSGKEPKKEEPKIEPAVPLDMAEVNEARAFAAELPARDKAMLNALRFLTIPEFQQELLRGRKHRRCVLEPIEQPGKGPMNITYALRLWAVLETGMPSSPGLVAEVNRLAATPVPAPTRSLAEAAVHLAILKCAASRSDWPQRAQLVDRARELHKLCEAAADVGSPRSPLVNASPNGTVIQAPWFANHFWRGIAVRSAAAMGIATESKQWGKDLDWLAKSYVDKQGWVVSKNIGANPGYDLHTNLLALAAFSLAAGAPDIVLSKGDSKAAALQLERGKEILARLLSYYPDLTFGGARLLPTLLLDGRVAPAGDKDGTKWVEAALQATLAQQGPSGNFMCMTMLAQEMELGESGYYRTQESVARESALIVIALCGGPFAKRAPLADKSIFDVGMMLHKLALVEAGAAKVLSGETRDLVNVAIDLGVDYLRTIQKKEGDFEGTYSSYASQTALCLLAMLHGGVPRDDKAIERGMKWLDEKKWAMLTYSYDAGIFLMLLQKYYEKEALNAGLLAAKTPEEFKVARKKLRDAIGAERNKIIDQILSNLDSARVTGANGGYTYGFAAQYGSMAGGDNSCTQYAMLAYHAGSLLGADVRGDVFKREVKRLLESFSEAKEIPPVVHEEEGAKGKKTAVKVTIQAGGWGYSCGKLPPNLQFSAAGMGTLAMCIDQLRLRGELAKEVEDQCEKAILGAALYISTQYAPANDPRQTLGGIGRLEMAQDGHGAYYNLYSVERGCSLAKIRMLNGTVDWYAIGARLLIDAQNDDGSWSQGRAYGRGASTPAAVNTCMAILFLKRAAMPVLTDHKKRDRTPDEPPPEEPKKEGPITGK